MQKMFLKISQNSQENTCVGVPSLIELQIQGLHFINKETSTQVFSCEFWEIFKNIFLTKHLRARASKHTLIKIWHT